MKINEQTAFSILNNNRRGLVWLDENLQIVFFNRAAESLFGFSQTEAIGKTIHDLIPSQQHLSNAIFLESMFRNGSNRTFGQQDIYARRKNGSELVLKVSTNQVFDRGKLYILLTVWSEISKTQEVENNPAVGTLKTLESLFDNIRDYIFVLDQRGCIIRVNRQVVDWLGFSESDLVGKPVSQVYPPELQSKAEEIISDLQNGIRPKTSLPLLTRTEKQVLVETFFDSANWDNQAVWIGVSRDISERERIRNTLIESENRFFQVFTLNHEVMLIISIESGSIVSGNQAASQFYGYSVAELNRMKINDLVKTDFDLHSIGEEINRGSIQHLFLHQHQLANGELRIVEAHISPLIYQNQTCVFMIVQDISNRIEIENALKKSRLQLAQALEGSRVGLWDWTIQTGEVLYNERWANIVGYSVSELSPRIETWASLCHPEDLEYSTALLNKHFAKEMPYYECRVRMRHKDGRWVWVLDRGRVTEWDSSGAPLHMLGTHQDVTEQVIAEEKLNFRSNLEDLLTRISTRFISLHSSKVDDAIHDALCEIGLFEKVDRCYIFLADNQNRTISNTHEWCAEDIEPQIQILQNLPFDMLPWWMNRIEAQQPLVIPCVADMPSEAQTEKELLQVQGILSVIVLPLFADGALLGFVGFDAVTAPREWDNEHVALLQQFGNILSSSFIRKWTEAALIESEERYKAVLNAIPDSMFRISREGIILDYFSGDIEDLLIPAEEIRGTSLTAVLGNTLASKAIEKIKQVLISRQRQTFEYQLTINGRLDYFEARFVASGEDEVVAIVRNVSERAHLEQMKSDFMNRAVHDLRTPITTIILMVRLLEGDCTPEENQEYWGVLKDELEREKVLIQDLLTVGQLESNRWKVKKYPVNLLSPLQISIQSIAPQAVGKHIEIEFNKPDCGGQIMADETSLQQVFTNLLNNAIKFNSEGGKISVNYQEDGQRAMINIRDTGIGIPETDIPNLFSRFFRGQNAIEQEVPGSGLGLYIVKTIMEHFEGRVQVQSSLGAGTTFKLEFPLLKME